MKSRQFTVEHSLYILIFILALGVRGINLGAAPLSDFEAGWALRAGEVAGGEQVTLGSQPGYGLLTGLTFFLFGSWDALARIWPVLAGSGLVVLPFLFRQQLGQKAALVLVLGLALDPGLVALSRLAGGPMMAVGFGLLAVASWFAGWPVATGILGGLMLLSGPAALAGAFGIGLAWFLVRILKIFHTGDLRDERDPAGTLVQPNHAIRNGLFSAGTTILLAGTLFLRFPQGIGALAGAFPAYVAGWLTPSGVPASRLLLALVAYQPLALVFGLLAVGRVWVRGENFPGKREVQALSLWFLAALALPLLYPGRQVGDLAWALVPLWALAAIELARYWRWEGWQDAVPWGLAAMVVILLTSVWLNLAGLTFTQPSQQDYGLRWLIILSSVILAGLSTTLVVLGWSFDAAKRGLVWGVGISLSLYMLAGVWGTSTKYVAQRRELWVPDSAAVQADLLLGTLGDLSEWEMGRKDSLDVVVQVDTPSMRWALRSLPNIRFYNTITAGESPSVIITRGDHDGLNLASAYRGQDFVWWVRPSWNAMTGLDWLRWLVFRDTPATSESVIFWARWELFLSG